MASQPSAVQIEPIFSRNLVREEIRSALRLFAGRGCRWSVKDLGVAAGVDPDNIFNATRPVHDPNFRALKLEELFSIAKYLAGQGYGVEFVKSFLEPCGLGAFDLMEPRPLDGVLNSSPTKKEKPADKVKRLSRELADALEDL